jgi:hypothetical protein
VHLPLAGSFGTMEPPQHSAGRPEQAVSPPAATGHRPPADEQPDGQAQAPPQLPASQELAASTADLVGELARQDRTFRQRLTAPLTALARRRQVAVVRLRLSGMAAQLSEQGGKVAGQSAKVAGQGVRAAGRRAQAAARGVRYGASRLADQVLVVAPRLPVRDQATLRRQFPGQTPDELAETLIAGASRMSATVGAAVGTWAVLPFLPGVAAEMAAETLTVVGIEIKLVAELHEAYGQRVPGSAVDRMTAYTGAWANRRGVGVTPAGVVLAVGSPMYRRLQRRLAARTGQSAFALGPLLTGAVASALINRRETRRLGREVADDLRKRAAHAGSGWPDR